MAERSDFSSLRLFFLQLPFWSAVVLLVLVALLVLSLRSLIPYVNSVRPELQQRLNQWLPFEIEVERLDASLFRIDPAIYLDDLVFSRNKDVFLQLQRVELELDTLDSLLAWSPRMKAAHLSGLDVWFQETPQGWRLAGSEDESATALDAVETEQGNARDALFQALDWVEQLLVQGELDFDNLRLHFRHLQGETLTFSAESLNYRRWSGGRQLIFEVEVSVETTQKAQLVITLEGEDFDPATSTLEAWLNLPLVSLSDFRSFWPLDWQARLQDLQGQVSLQAWFRLEAGQSSLELQLQDLALQLDADQTLQLGALTASMQGHPLDWMADWRIQDLDIAPARFERLEGRVHQTQAGWTLQLKELSLDALLPHLQQDARLPEGLQALLLELEPGGTLQHITLTLPEEKSRFELVARLQDMRVAAYQGAPSAQGVHGWLRANAQGGQVVFGDHALRLGFPALYQQSWAFSDARGQVDWRIDGNHFSVSGERLSVTLPMAEPGGEPVRVTGRFAYDYTGDDQRFYLNLGLLSAPMQAHQQLIPGRLIDQKLADWLDAALLDGWIPQAGFVYAGSILSGKPATFQFAGDFERSRFAYDPAWPVLEQASGRLLLTEALLAGQVSQARMAEARLSEADFSTQGYELLQVGTRVDTDLAFFPWLVANSPLQDEIPKELQSWRYAGQARGQLQLQIPLVTRLMDQLQVDLDTEIRQGQLRIDQIDLPVSDIHGTLRFSLEQGLASPGLTGQVLGQSVTAAFHTSPHTRLTFNTRLSLQRVADWQQWPLPEWLEGDALLQGELDFGSLQLILESDLQGVALRSPFPWPKAADQALLTQASLDFSDPALPLRLRAGDVADFRMDINQPEHGMGLQLSDQQAAVAGLPGSAGLQLSAVLTRLDLQVLYLWLEALKTLLAETQATDVTATETRVALAPGLSWLQGFELQVADTHWDDKSLGEVALNAELLPSGLQLMFASDHVDGQLWWPVDETETLDLLLGRLHLSAPRASPDDGRSPVTAAPLDRLAGYDPSGLRNAYLQIDDLRVDGKQLGRWNARLQQQPGSLLLDNIYGEFGQSNLSAVLNWHYQGDEPRTELQGQWQGRNLAPALQILTGDTAPLQSSRHRMSYDLQWPGSPAALQLAQTEGQIALDLDDGYFPQTDGALRGISSFFGLLNMDTLLRRLRLDFSDLTARGVSYDSIRGQYSLHAGQLKTVKPTRIESSSTRMTLNGGVDLVDETLDLQLTVVLPVAQSLPLAAILVGAPQVGAGIWVMQKLFGNLFDTFTEARYKVTGPMVDPKFELQRVF